MYIYIYFYKYKFCLQEGNSIKVTYKSYAEKLFDACD